MLDALAEVVEVFAVSPELAVEAVGGHLVVQVAGGQLIPAGPELLHSQDDVDHQGALKHLQQEPDEDSAAAVGDGIKGAQELQQAQPQEAQPRRPEPQEEVQQSVPQVPGPGELSSVAVEDEVFSQDPRPVPPDQGDSACYQQRHRHPCQDQRIQGKNRADATAMHRDRSASHRHPEDKEDHHPQHQDICGNPPIHPRERDVAILLPAVASPTEQQGQGEDAQHPTYQRDQCQCVGAIAHAKGPRMQRGQRTRGGHGISGDRDWDRFPIGAVCGREDITIVAVPLVDMILVGVGNIPIGVHQGLQRLFPLLYGVVGSIKGLLFLYRKKLRVQGVVILGLPHCVVIGGE